MLLRVRFLPSPYNLRSALATVCRFMVFLTVQEHFRSYCTCKTLYSSSCCLRTAWYGPAMAYRTASFANLLVDLTNYCRCRESEYFCSCRHCRVWEKPATIFASIQGYFMAYCRSRDNVKVCMLLLSQYNLAGTCNNVQNYTFDWSAAMGDLINLCIILGSSGIVFANPLTWSMFKSFIWFWDYKIISLNGVNQSVFVMGTWRIFCEVWI